MAMTQPRKRGEKSRRLYCTEDARAMARRRVPRLVFDFVDGAAGSESAERLNRQMLELTRLQPRVLVNVDGRTLGKRFLGYDMALARTLVSGV